MAWWQSNPSPPTEDELRRREVEWYSFPPRKRVFNQIIRHRRPKSGAIHQTLIDYANIALNSIDIAISAFAKTVSLSASKSVVIRTFSLLSTADRLIQQELATGEYEKPECRSGCSHCCRQMLIVLGEDEVSLIAARLASMPENTRVGLLTNLEHGRKTGEEDTPCVFLLDNKCSIYDIRPIACRTYHSTSVDACQSKEASGENIALNTMLPYPFDDAIKESFRDALAPKQEKYSYEIHSIVQRILTDKDRLSSWSKGIFVDDGDISVIQPLVSNRLKRVTIPIKLV